MARESDIQPKEHEEQLSIDQACRRYVSTG